MHKITVNDRFKHDVEYKGEELIVDGKSLSIDFSNNSPHSMNVILENRSFNAEIVEVDKSRKTCVIKVNGNTYNINIKDQFDLLLKKLGLENSTSGQIIEVKAPMPGLVLKLDIKVGDEIKKGDNLLVLEAMKMENILKSATDGLIKSVLIKEGDKVDKNQILIAFW